MRTKLTRRNRSRRKIKRSRHKIKRGGNSNTWLPSFVVDMGRNTAYKFDNAIDALGGKYENVNPSPLSQPLI